MVSGPRYWARAAPRRRPASLRFSKTMPYASMTRALLTMEEDDSGGFGVRGSGFAIRGSASDRLRSTEPTRSTSWRPGRTVAPGIPRAHQLGHRDEAPTGAAK